MRILNCKWKIPKYTAIWKLCQNASKLKRDFIEDRQQSAFLNETLEINEKLFTELVEMDWRQNYQISKLRTNSGLRSDTNLWVKNKTKKIRCRRTRYVGTYLSFSELLTVHCPQVGLKQQTVQQTGQGGVLTT